ncbi:MAG: DUF302 domain-containing protein [Armatimonadetes bacterium]|nr:DUF302 domain-containing protein [Armatimonadota bacterium]
MAVVKKSGYTMRTRVNLPYDEAVARTKEALKAQGFGVLTEIDVKKTMKEKLGVDYRPYIILGACNPHLAHRALEAETEIGALLPCNVIVYEEDAGSVVAAVDPEMMLSVIGNPALDHIGVEAAERLRHVIEELSAVSAEVSPDSEA